MVLLCPFFGEFLLNNGIYFSKFRLSYYPHLLKNFNGLLEKVFGEDAKHTVLGDFEPLDPSKNPAYYIHIIQKQ